MYIELNEDVKNEIRRYMSTEVITEEYKSKGEFVKLDSLNEDVKISFFEIVKQMPHMVANASTSDLYRVVIDKPGELMKLSSGGLSTTLVDENHKIVGSAKLFEAGTNVAQITSNIFSVASVVTGMYYMKTISAQLESTSRMLIEIKQWLKNLKLSELNEMTDTLKLVSNEYPLTINNESIRTTNLTLLKQVIRTLKQNIYFFINQFDSDVVLLETTKDTPKIVNNKIADLKKDLNSVKQLHTLLTIAYLLELYYSGIHEEEFVKLRKHSLEEITINLQTSADRIKSVAEKYIKSRHTTIGEKIKYSCTLEAIFPELEDFAIFKLKLLPVSIGVNMARRMKKQFDINKEKKIRDEAKVFSKDASEENVEIKLTSLLDNFGKPIELIVAKNEICMIR